MEDNRFLIARREFTSVFLNVARSKRNWQLVAFTTLALLCIREVSYQRYAAGSRITPYVVEVDRFGRAQAFGPADSLKMTDRRVIIAQLAQFIRAVRTVLPDVTAQADMMRLAYAFAAPPTAAFLNDYFTRPEHDPRLLGEQYTRTVEVTSVLQLPGSSTWKIQWTETSVSHQAMAAPQPSAWEAYLTIKIVPPATTETIQVNPLGLYVTALTWTQVGADPAAQMPTVAQPPPEGLRPETTPRPTSH